MPWHRDFSLKQKQLNNFKMVKTRKKRKPKQTPKTDTDPGQPLILNEAYNTLTTKHYKLFPLCVHLPGAGFSSIGSTFALQLQQAIASTQVQIPLWALV